MIEYPLSLWPWMLPPLRTDVRSLAESIAVRCGTDLASLRSKDRRPEMIAVKRKIVWAICGLHGRSYAEAGRILNLTTWTVRHHYLKYCEDR